MRRHFLARVTVVQQQGLLQQSFDLPWKLRRRPGGPLNHLLAAPDQVCQAGLMVGLAQAAIAAQPVMHQPTVVVRTQHLLQLLGTATGQNAVHRHQVTFRHPQPLRMTAHPPAGFIHPVDVALAPVPRSFGNSPPQYRNGAPLSAGRCLPDTAARSASLAPCPRTSNAPTTAPPALHPRAAAQAGKRAPQSLCRSCGPAFWVPPSAPLWKKAQLGDGWPDGPSPDPALTVRDVS